jgi:hypothetical protein
LIGEGGGYVLDWSDTKDTRQCQTPLNKWKQISTLNTFSKNIKTHNNVLNLDQTNQQRQEVRDDPPSQNPSPKSHHACIL